MPNHTHCSLSCEFHILTFLRQAQCVCLLRSKVGVSFRGLILLYYTMAEAYRRADHCFKLVCPVYWRTPLAKFKHNSKVRPSYDWQCGHFHETWCWSLKEWHPLSQTGSQTLKPTLTCGWRKCNEPMHFTALVSTFLRLTLHLHRRAAQ